MIDVLTCCRDSFSFAVDAQRLPIEVVLPKGSPKRRGVKPNVFFVFDALPAYRLPVLAASVASARPVDDLITSWAVTKCFHVTTLMPSRRLAVRLSLVAVVSVT